MRNAYILAIVMIACIGRLISSAAASVLYFALGVSLGAYAATHVFM